MARFPRLRRIPFLLTSPETPAYNCIAWAAGDDSRWWWPGQGGFAYWPEGIRAKEDLETFISLFESFGYQRCDNPTPKKGVEKVAIFVDANNNPTHAARQLANGRWTSKLGKWEDIEHTLFGLESGHYGNAAVFFERLTTRGPFGQSGKGGKRKLPASNSRSNNDSNEKSSSRS